MAVKQPREGRLVAASRGHDQFIVRQFSRQFSGRFSGHFIAHLSVCLGGHFDLLHFRWLLSWKLANICLRSLSDSLFHPGSWNRAFGRLEQIGAISKGGKKFKLVTEIFPSGQPRERQRASLHQFHQLSPLSQATITTVRGADPEAAAGNNSANCASAKTFGSKNTRSMQCRYQGRRFSMKKPPRPIVQSRFP